MDLQDFKYNYKYKIIIPIVYIISWIAMFMGPFLIQITYQKVCIILLLYLTTKSIMILTISIINYYKFRQTLKKAVKIKEEHQHADTLQHNHNPDVLHAFIIPNYREDLEMLAQTMEKLAQHQGATTRYMLFLAMQAHQEGSDIKGHQLVKDFQNKFLMVGFTRHQIRDYQQKGKASNVSWCAQHLQQLYFNKHNIPLEKVVLTIIDADSWVPEVYIREIDDHLAQPSHINQRQRYIYQSNQIFTRNHLDVPVVTRVYDQVHGSMHSNNTFSVFSVTYPLSNYSLHFSLAKRVGWWDTCADAIGEDFHMTEKAFWKTQGHIIAVPIMAPFNQLSIQTGKGYWADIKARFWQAQRHARGVSDVPYNINMLIKQPFRWKTFLASWIVIQNYFMPALIPWALTAMTYEYNVLFKYTNHSPFLISSAYFNPLYNVNTFCLVVAYFFYYLQKRKATSFYYGLQNQSLLRIVQYPLLFFLTMTVISIPSYVISAFGALVQGREYVVAEKVTNSKI